ncbi:aminotransferase class I/II-fold pyridoxal phosphate-dependent enzyme [Bacillus sp. ms-22]|uniref:MocR-like pyridoxine biosynthesis transcription factor PdxR n=1 Tax=Bacillus sp. ms-22 TaxID=2683680 RepID=UPI0012F838F8|nr:PLP-dependent aminotransferase family protein [Bacillus sp. ms-22]QGX66623.1 aminotransferase class I/II-fold pyridoxal phosphate-dependent enzyme [Bacillus sp. ms-22]
MYIHLDRSSSTPLWQQIVTGIIQKIHTKTLNPDDQLTPSRVLAQELNVSRSTVQLAYDELLARGYVSTSRRGGTKVISSDQYAASPPRQSEPPFALPVRPHFDVAEKQMDHWLSANQFHEKLEIDFRHQEPAIDEHFQNIWKRSLLKALQRLDMKDWGYSSPHGLWEVRSEIRQYLSVERGIEIEEDQMVLTGGTQQAIDLISQVLLKKGDMVAVEDPGFPGARLSFLHREMNIHPAAVDEEGMIVDTLPERTKLIAVTPSHQRPTGVCMSVNRRQQLLQFAVKHQSYILEDDFDGDYRYHGGPLPSLFSEAPDHVIYILSFSKVLAPGIRLAAIIGSQAVVKEIAALQSLIQRQLPIMEQITLASFFREGEFNRYVRRMRQVYKKRQAAMMHALLTHHFDKHFHLYGTDTGLHVFLEGTPDFDEKGSIEAAKAAGVGIYPLSPYCYESERKGLLLGFACTDEDMIQEGVRRLKQTFRI